MFGITTIVEGYSIQTYFLYCYAIFISEDITRQRGGLTFVTPCNNKDQRIEIKIEKKICYTILRKKTSISMDDDKNSSV